MSLLQWTGDHKKWSDNPLICKIISEACASELRYREARHRALEGKDIPDDVRPI